MTDQVRSLDFELPTNQEVAYGPTLRLDALSEEMTQQALFYARQYHRPPTDEISLLFDVLDKFNLTMDELTQDELARLDEHEENLFHQHLIEDDQEGEHDD